MKRLLVFLRLVDQHDGNISLTNIALIVVITKLTLVRTPGLGELGTLLLALANYNAKKWMAPDPPVLVQAKVEAAQMLTAVGIKQ